MPPTLRDTLAHRYTTAMPWIVHCAATGMHHGWALATAMMSPADADRVLSVLQQAGFLVRGKQDLAYAVEIKAFGVGGTTGKWLVGAPYGCTYVWSPTELLRETLWPSL